MAHYFDNNPTSNSDRKMIKCFIMDKHFSFLTDNDVFSKKGLDFGTRTLLESIDVDNMTGDILDFGCGYGPIGIYFASLGFNVDMVDINNRALELSIINAKNNHVEANIFHSNIYENINKKYPIFFNKKFVCVAKNNDNCRRKHKIKTILRLKNYGKITTRNT